MPRWPALLCLLTAAAPAWAQPSMTDRVRVGPNTIITSAMNAQVVLVNDGLYALVDHKSANDKQKSKSAEATCPAGMKAVSAGWGAASGAGEPKDYRMILSMPKDSGNGWVVFARFDGKGDFLAADFDWELRIRVVCLKVG